MFKSDKIVDAAAPTYGTSTRLAASTLMLLLVTTLVSCANTPGGNSRDTAALQNPAGTDIWYLVKPGDYLTQISIDLTGSRDHWRSIARINDLKNPNQLRIGMRLRIPGELLLARAETRIQQPPVLEGQQRSVQPQQAVLATRSTRHSQPSSTREPLVFQPSSLPGVKTASVRMIKVPLQTEFDIQPLGRNSLNNPRSADESRVSSAVSTGIRPQMRPTPPAAPGKVPQMVRVIGSYYPKGIYAQPFSYSPLLMRVAPGTTMRLQRTLGDWLQVETDNGLGFLRQSDAELLDATTAGQVSS